MERFFCYGKNDFCDGKVCTEECNYFDGSGGEKREAETSVFEDVFGKDYDLERLCELAEADRDGRCVVLPCKENDTVFYLTGKPTLKAGQSFERVEEGKVDGFYWDRRGIQIRIRNPKGNHGTYGFFGETVYTDKRAAEAELKGDQHGEQ